VEKRVKLDATTMKATLEKCSTNLVNDNILIKITDKLDKNN